MNDACEYVKPSTWQSLSPLASPLNTITSIRKCITAALQIIDRGQVHIRGPFIRKRRGIYDLRDDLDYDLDIDASSSQESHQPRDYVRPLNLKFLKSVICAEWIQV